MSRRLFRIVAASAFLAEWSGPAFTQGMDGSPHDLALSGAGGSTDNGEICVFCHTPHGGRTDIEAPLWNKPANGASYQTYEQLNPSTLDGAILPVGSVSIACLTCHDGTQAMDAVINAPGSGPGTGDLGPLGIMPPFSFATLGTDLRNDHPIGVQYGGFNDGSGPVDPDFKDSSTGLQVTNILGRDRWWVDTEETPNGVRDKTDMILYTRDNGGADQPFVECASCHDPHRGVGTVPRFMRIANVNSDVCLACHVK